MCCILSRLCNMYLVTNRINQLKVKENCQALHHVNITINRNALITAFSFS